MLVRVTGNDPPFVAGVVFDENGLVRVAAPILKWAIDMDEKTFRAELTRRGLTATLVRTLTRAETTTEGTP
jgi:hypothetical protein